MQKGLKIMGDIDIKQGLKSVLEKIAAACEKRNPVILYVCVNFMFIVTTYILGIAMFRAIFSCC